MDDLELGGVFSIVEWGDGVKVPLLEIRYQPDP